ncbi:hypothetical protein MCOR31_011900 [Pyricularia oryzae]|nr:hypothetical protein MCOR26_011335 [Pyricularia oryzae]KAI6311026.1 hypothetical protein MCOR30_010968 [Pyricularia oryzae]KAI6337444.1 hypothetical protein MCOR28_008525 [Pyricularia oryzae]KAI6352287.1 hypothetical protein MCOR31_011900 [Pyricularia oryzae]KAI6359224.1 hypothetical protein MCOR32_009334 [Pyricularia oryzae]
MEGNFVDLLHLFDVVELAAQFDAGKDLPAEIKKLFGVLVDFMSSAEHLETEERKRLGQTGPLKNRAEYFRVLNEIKVARDHYPGIMEVTPSDLVNPNVPASGVSRLTPCVSQTAQQRVASHALAAPRLTPLSPHYRVFQMMNMKFEEAWSHWEQQEVAWVEAHRPPVDPAPADPNNGPGPPGAGVPLALRPGKVTVSNSGHAHQRLKERRAVPVETPARPSYARTVVSQTILRSNERLQFTRPDGNPVTPPRPASQRGGRSPANQATSRSSRLFLSGGAGRDQFSTGMSPKKRSGAPLESPNKRQG